MLEVAHDDRQKKIRPIAEILDEETDKLHRLSIAKTPLTGTPSGFKDLDEMTGGFQPGNLIVIAARPSMGKSALVANIAENAVLGVGTVQRPVALFSLEMSESELAQRFVASQARIRGEDLRKGRVAENRSGRRSSTPASGCPARRCASTTRATPACSRSAPRRAACTTSSRAASG